MYLFYLIFLNCFLICTRQVDPGTIILIIVLYMSCYVFVLIILQIVSACSETLHVCYMYNCN